MMLEKVLTFDEVRELVRCSRSRLYWMLGTKQIRAARVGRVWRIGESAIVDWLRGNVNDKAKTRPAPRKR